MSYNDRLFRTYSMFGSGSQRPRFFGSGSGRTKRKRSLSQTLTPLTSTHQPSFKRFRPSSINTARTSSSYSSLSMISNMGPFDSSYSMAYKVWAVTFVFAIIAIILIAVSFDSGKLDPTKANDIMASYVLNTISFLVGLFIWIGPENVQDEKT